MLIEERQRATNHNTQSCTLEQNELGETVTITTFILIKVKLKWIQDGRSGVGGVGWGAV